MVDHYKILKEKGVEEKRQQLIFIWNFKQKMNPEGSLSKQRYGFAVTDDRRSLELIIGTRIYQWFR